MFECLGWRIDEKINNPELIDSKHLFSMDKHIVYKV
jgi:hypothetical protein